MINWRDVRSQGELQEFLQAFNDAAKGIQLEIRAEMAVFLDDFKGFNEMAVENFELKALRLKEPTVGAVTSPKRPRKRRRPR